MFILHPAVIIMASLGVYSLSQALSTHARVSGVGSNTYALLMLALGLWQLAYAFEIAATTLALDLIFAQASYVGVVLVPPLWFTFALQYATWGRHPRLGLQAALLLIPFATLSMVLVDPVGGWVWQDVRLYTAGPFPIMQASYGPWFWVHTAYSYAMMLGGSSLVMWSVIRGETASAVTRGHVIAATLLPFLANLTYVFGSPAMRAVDISPIVLCIASVWLVRSLDRNGLLPALSVAEFGIMDHLRDGVLLESAGGRVMAANDAALEIFDVSRQELVGARMRDTSLVDVMALLADDRETAQIALSRRESAHDFLVKSSPVSDDRGRPWGRLIVFEDITQRVASEKAMHASLARMRALVNNLEHGILVVDKEGNVLLCNERVIRIFGLGITSIYEEQQVESLFAEIIAATRDGCVSLDLCWEAYKQSTSIPSHDVTLVDGRIIECGGYPVESDNRLGYVWVWEDVTQQRLLEQSSQELALFDHVGRLAGGIAHEYNNLLTMILGYAEMLLNDASESSPQREFAATIIEAGQRAADLTHQLLAYSRRQQLRMETVEINGLLNRWRPDIERVVGSSGVQIAYRFLPADIIVICDVDQILEAVLRLVDNACDAMSEGGTLTLGVETADLSSEDAPRYSVAPGRFGVITVQDTGTGISDPVLERMFEPFYSTKGVGKGTGLGLPMVQGVLRQCHGFVRVESTVGEGSRFSLYLPTVSQA